MGNPFSWDYLTTVPGSNEIVGPFSIVFVLFFAIGFVISTWLYYRPWQPPIGQYVRRRTVLKASSIAMWVFGIGLFFFLIRLLQINPFTFGMRLWMYLSFLVAIVLVAWYAYQLWKAIQQEPYTRTDTPRRSTRPTQNRRPVRRRRA